MKRARWFSMGLAILLALGLPIGSLAEREDDLSLWTNILMIGSDVEGGGEEQTQTFVILSVNTTDRQVFLTSILQDVAVQTPQYGEKPLRELFSLGGVELVLEAVNELFDLTMERYILIDMTPLSRIVDTLGGVTIDIDDDVFDELLLALTLAQLVVPANVGAYTFTGPQALIYSRLLKDGVSYAYNHCQRDVIIAASQKVLQSGVFACLRIVPTLFDMLTMNLSFGELIGMVYGLAGIDVADIREVWSPGEVTQIADTDDGWILRVDAEQCAERFRESLMAASAG